MDKFGTGKRNYGKGKQENSAKRPDDYGQLFLPQGEKMYIESKTEKQRMKLTS